MAGGGCAVCGVGSICLGRVNVWCRVVSGWLAQSLEACLPRHVLRSMPPLPPRPPAGYLRNYATSRVPRILDTAREVVALHKHRFVFGVTLCVTPVTLGGERLPGQAGEGCGGKGVAGSPVVRAHAKAVHWLWME